MRAGTQYPVPNDACGVCASDAAGDVIAVDSEAIKLKVEDHVAPTIDLEALTRDCWNINSDVLSGNGPGVRMGCTYFERKYWVKLPDHLSWAEVSGVFVHRSRVLLTFLQASTITVAGTMTWVALNCLQGLTQGAIALLQGNGELGLVVAQASDTKRDLEASACSHETSAFAASITLIITPTSNLKLGKLKDLDLKIELTTTKPVQILLQRCVD